VAPWEPPNQYLDAAYRQMIQAVVVTTVTSRVSAHCAIVKEMWGKRELIAAFTPPMQAVWNGGAPAGVIKEVERALMELRGKVEDDGQSTVVSSFQAAEWLDAQIRTPPDLRAGVGTPFRFLKRFQPGRLYVLGGYAKDGKTALSVQFLKAAASEGKRVGFFSIEMSWQDLTNRIASTYGVPYTGLQDGFVGEPFMAMVTKAIKEMTLWQVDLVDDSLTNPGEIARQQRIGRYDYIIIDYLQRMDYADRFELNRIIKGITTLARTANVPILLLSQFSRPQGGGFPRPTMSMFAETSMIEKEASMALALWRKRDEMGKPGNDAEMIVLANRYGPPGIRSLQFRPDEVCFVETRPDAA